jgi:hypothetical protein
MPRTRASTLRVMDDPRIRLAHDSLTLLSAAERLQQGAGDRASAPSLPAAWGCIGQSLHALSRGCDAAANGLVPPGGHDESISRRYARSADAWPGAVDGAGPSHERQAELLASLDAAAAALRAAAERCVRASRVLTATMDARRDCPVAALVASTDARHP